MFKKERSEATILDFTDGFREKKITIETRTDAFTRRVSRVVTFRWKLPASSHDRPAIDKSRDTCPFCPERIKDHTPRFPPDLIPEGRIQHNATTIIPNAFPYCQYCGVAIFSGDHYLSMDRITKETLLNALEASLLFFKRVNRYDSRVRYPSINWNYMPTSGGSLFHPHFQVVANPNPTTFHAHLIHASQNYHQQHEQNYWADLVAFEKEQGYRYLFSIGRVHFLSTYSPGGIFGEVLVVFDGVSCMAEFTPPIQSAFADGMIHLLKMFHRLHLDNLNMTLLMSIDPDPDCWVQARIMPRIVIPPWGTSDVNYFEKGHDERVVIFSPEELATEIRKTVEERS